MKYLFISLFSILLITCTSKEKVSEQKDTLVPYEALWILKFKELKSLSNLLNTNQFVTDNENHHLFKHLNNLPSVPLQDYLKQPFYLSFSILGKKDIGYILSTHYTKEISDFEKTKLSDSTAMEYNKIAYHRFKIQDTELYYAKPVSYTHLTLPTTSRV